MVGSEGPGLTPAALRAADLRVRIPMTGGVDSLNVATAAAIAFAACVLLMPHAGVQHVRHTGAVRRLFSVSDPVNEVAARTVAAGAPLRCLR